MSSTRRHDCRSLSKWAVALATLGLTAPAADAAFARNLTLTLAPELPTWEDSVRLRVAGEVETACGVSVMHLANVRKPTTVSAPLGVDVALVEAPCLLPTLPTTVPFALEVDLGHLLPGSTTVLVHDLADGTVAQQTVLVHNVSRLGLDVPPVASSSIPVKVGVTYFDDCSQIQ